MSLKFLNLKSFHPANQANQKRVWVAEQKAKAREQQEAEAAREVLKNADAQRFQRLAAAQGDAEAARRLDAQQVGFLYEPPPGLQKAEAPARDGDEEDGGSHVAEGARCL
jgi:CBF1 interacting corepressor